jgi:hypothetical protein
MSRSTALKTFLMVGVCAFACSGIFGASKSGAGTRTAVVLIEAADRIGRAAAEEGISAPVGRVAVVRASAAAAAMEASAEDSEEAGRRDIRRWHGRVAARTEARRHARRAAIRRGRTAAEAMGALAGATVAHLTGRVGLVTAADTETPPTGTLAGTVDLLMEETADLTAVLDGADRPMRTATTPRRVRVTDAAVATARRQIAAIPA